MSEPQGAYRWVLHGRVQGVGFRYFTQQVAGRLGIRGWVRNRADGAVEVVGAGAAEALEEFEERLRQGPPAGRVERVERDREAGEAELDGFSVRR